MGSLWVCGRMPGQNELLAGRAHASHGWSEYNSTKQRLAAQVILLARVKGLSSIGPSYFTYLFVEPNQKRDPSNVVSGGIKVLEDAFVKGGFLENDGWAHVLGFVGYWVKRDKGGCLAHWRSDRLASKDEMVVLLEEEMKNGNNVDGFGNAHDEPGHPPRRKTRARRTRARGQLPVR